MENRGILLRKPKFSDVSGLLKVKNNQEASFLLGGTPPIYTEESIKQWINYHNSCLEEELFVIIDKSEEIVIGHVGFYKIDKTVKSAEFAILIGNVDYIGKGIGKQVTSMMINFAFIELSLNRVSLSLLNENIPALNLYKKIGFKQEGYLKQSVWKNGRYYDNILMSILKQDYEL